MTAIVQNIKWVIKIIFVLILDAQILLFKQIVLTFTLSIRHDGISRLEKRSDLLLCTLHGYVSAMGGNLSLVVEFPDCPPIKLHGLGEIDSGDIAQQQGRRAPTINASKSTISYT